MTSSQSIGSFERALEEARRDRVPVLALRPDHEFPDELDDVVVKHIETLHFEAMSDKVFWMACTFANGEEAVFHWTIGKNPARLVVSATSLPGEWQDWDELYRKAFRG